MNLEKQSILVRVLFLWRETMAHCNSYRGKHLIGADSLFRGLVHYRHGGKHGSIQANVVLEKEPGVLNMDSQASGKVSATLSIG